MQFLDYMLYQNTLLRWLIALGVAIGTAFVLGLLRRLITRQLDRLSKRTATDLDDIISRTLKKTRGFFLFTVGLWIGSQFLTLPERVETGLRWLIVVVTVIQFGFWSTTLVRALIDRHARTVLETDPGAATTMRAMGVIASLALWLVLALMGLQNLGIEIGPLLAAMGVGGIAIAFALQNVLSDLFASLSIVLDKPFVIGDFVTVGDMAGTIEQIGLKTTRLRSLSGEQLVFSNSDLLASRIRNFKRMQERRALFTVGVTYQTPQSKLAKVPGMIREIIEAEKLARFDRAHFKQFGAFSLDFEVVFYVQQPDFNSYMDTQQAINLAIFKRFEEEGIEFAYPTQTLFVDRVQLPEEFAGTNGEGRGDGGRAAQERDRTAGAARGDRS
jgi:small-conductance mechanosensitive channel